MKKKFIVSFIIGGILVSSLIIIIVQRAGTRREKYPLKEQLSRAQTYIKEDNLIEARKVYKEILRNVDEPKRLEEIKKRLEDLTIKIIFSPILDECSFEYTVKPNDSLIKIAKQFGTTVGLIKRANNLTSDLIMPNQKLKINKCTFSIAIDKSQNFLFLKRGSEVIKTYVVASGKGNSTPTGTLKIVMKLKDPTWYKAGAIVPPDSSENILGSRWMALDIKGYGIHGSRDINEIGKQVTEGCIRMKNEEVEELFDIVPVGTEVIIVD